MGWQFRRKTILDENYVRKVIYHTMYDLLNRQNQCDPVTFVGLFLAVYILGDESSTMFFAAQTL